MVVFAPRLLVSPGRCQPVEANSLSISANTSAGVVDLYQSALRRAA